MKIKNYVTYGIAFILGAGAGWIISGKYWNIFFTSYVPALATLLAAFYGAKYAFLFQSEKEKAGNKNKNIVNGNLAIFNLMRMANILYVYRKQFIEPNRKKLSIFLEMPPSLELLEAEINFNVENLFFLFESDSINFLGELMAEKTRFQSALDAINERSRVHRFEVQHVLDKAGFLQGGNCTVDQVKTMLGERLYHTIVGSTEQVISHVDDTIASLQSAGDKLTELLKRIFPGELVISFKFEE